MLLPHTLRKSVCRQNEQAQKEYRMTQENTTSQSASQRKVKHVKVFDEQHSKINATVWALVSEFHKEAKALGIRTTRRGKFNNAPGQTEAVEYLLSGEPLDSYIRKLIQRTTPQGAV
jgi:tRNA(Ser,Leu) C12 N-acetylase TAN1